MTRIVADLDLKTRLRDFSVALEICDESGRTVGFFHPGAVHDPSVYEWAKGEFTDEELERSRRDPVSYTTAEVLEHLGNL